jgi:group I intron endonuclease
MSIGIYGIKNTIDGKWYIGQSIQIQSRQKHHCSSLEKKKHRNRYLQYAYNKYGKDSFEFHILEICSKKLLDSKEISWIKRYKSNNDEFGYNLTNGGYTTRGYKHREDTKFFYSFSKCKTREYIRTIVECIDCGKKFTSVSKTLRCVSCSRRFNIIKYWNKKGKKVRNLFCIDCGKKLGRYFGTRCQSCNGKVWSLRLKKLWKNKEMIGMRGKKHKKKSINKMKKTKKGKPSPFKGKVGSRLGCPNKKS